MASSARRSRRLGEDPLDPSSSWAAAGWRPRSVGGEAAAVEGDEATAPSRAGADPEELPEELARAASWSVRKRAIVAWSGTWLAVMTR